jgi:hypothetical protein
VQLFFSNTFSIFVFHNQNQKIMNALQNARISALDRTNSLIDQNINDLLPIDEIKIQIDAIKTIRSKITDAVISQGGSTTIVTDEVYLIRETMAKTIIKYAKRALGLAQQKHLTTLITLLDHPISYINQASNISAVIRCTEIMDVIKNNLAIFTNINAAQIDEMAKSIEAYNKVKDKPVLNIQHSSTAGTKQIKELLNQASGEVNTLFNFIESYFADIKPEMVDEFALAKTIINRGTHHSGVEGKVMVGNTPYANATIKIRDTAKTTTTDIQGHYIISKIPTGDYFIDCILTDGKTQSNQIHISSGVIIVVDFEY